MADDDKQSEIEATFLQSWSMVEHHYKGLLRELEEGNYYYDYAKKALILISSIRGYEYDKTTHAGTQLSQLILSRAEQYGLQSGQHHIRVSFSEDEPRLILQYFGDDEEQFEFDNIEITDEVRVVLDRLVAQPIN